jgi:hypothetical protein
MYLNCKQIGVCYFEVEFIISKDSNKKNVILQIHVSSSLVRCDCKTIGIKFRIKVDNTIQSQIK